MILNNIKLGTLTTTSLEKRWEDREQFTRTTEWASPLHSSKPRPITTFPRHWTWKWEPNERRLGVRLRKVKLLDWGGFLRWKKTLMQKRPTKLNGRLTNQQVEKKEQDVKHFCLGSDSWKTGKLNRRTRPWRKTLSGLEGLQSRQPSRQSSSLVSYQLNLRINGFGRD